MIILIFLKCHIGVCFIIYLLDYIQIYRLKTALIKTAQSVKSERERVLLAKINLYLNSSALHHCCSFVRGAVQFQILIDFFNAFQKAISLHSFALNTKSSWKLIKLHNPQHCIDNINAELILIREHREF